MTDTISIVKPDGRRFDKIKSAVTRNVVHFDDVSVPLEEGDFIERVLPNGMKEVYEVVDRGYYSGGGGIPDHYQARVQKTTTPPSRYQQAITHINISGTNARLNLGSTDNSTNVVRTGETEAVFSQLTSIIQTQIASADERAALLAQAEQMQKTAGAAGYTRAYQDFIQLAANVITIFAPLLPALTSLLPS